MTVSVRRHVDVRGVVQGVGFRPFVHRLADECGLTGFVRNRVGDVHIEIEGPPPSVDEFVRRLARDAPPLARIETIATRELPRAGSTEFTIATSPQSADVDVAVVPPDTATCDRCVAELFDPADRRYRHPFVTCTDCGPRFTIVTSLPWDRPNTTMASFPMCDACRREYDDPNDRRHHAQPLSCPDCGPQLRFRRGEETHRGTDVVLAAVQRALANGEIVAIKGIGGYHLAVDATNDEAIVRLRDRKQRPHKPLAVMIPDVDAAARLVELDGEAHHALADPARPVVLAPARDDHGLSPGVAPGTSLIGVMVPYSPLHHLLFAPIPGTDATPPTALVLTSGNVSEEPICHDDGDVDHRLGHIADAVCDHDRRIHLPCDDSVTRVGRDLTFPVRRSRGHAPLPVALPTTVDPVLALGGDLKNTFALASGRRAWMSQHVGDMINLETERAFDTTLDLLGELYGIEPDVIVVDAHPGYRTHARGRALARARGVRLVEVQHHHAHLAALLAEHLVDTPAIGFVFDGTGHGSDGTSWGGEVLVGDHRAVERRSHLVGTRLPAGDVAASHPARAALAHLAAAGVAWTDDLPSVRACGADERATLGRQLELPAHSVISSSMGRLFDAVASIIGLRHRVTYEAQAAIELEALAAGGADPVPLSLDLDPHGRLDPGPLVRAVATAVRRGVPAASIALGFHLAVADAIVRCARRLQLETGIATVGLTGGVFQNVVLTERAVAALHSSGFEVLVHRLVPPNDGGIALGQAVIGAHRTEV